MSSEKLYELTESQLKALADTLLCYLHGQPMNEVLRGCLPAEISSLFEPRTQAVSWLGQKNPREEEGEEKTPAKRCLKQGAGSHCSYNAYHLFMHVVRGLQRDKVELPLGPGAASDLAGGRLHAAIWAQVPADAKVGE